MVFSADFFDTFNSQSVLEPRVIRGKRPRYGPMSIAVPRGARKLLASRDILRGDSNLFVPGLDLESVQKQLSCSCGFQPQTNSTATGNHRDEIGK